MLVQKSLDQVEGFNTRLTSTLDSLETLSMSPLQAAPPVVPVAIKSATSAPFIDQSKQQIIAPSAIDDIIRHDIERSFRIIEPEDNVRSWDKLSGLDHHKRKLEDFVEVLLDDVIGQVWRETMEGACGVLLYGPPGTGKTALIRALVQREGLPYIEVDTSFLL